MVVSACAAVAPMVSGTALAAGVCRLERRDLLAASIWWTAADAGAVGQDAGDENSLTIRAARAEGEGRVHTAALPVGDRSPAIGEGKWRHPASQIVRPPKSGPTRTGTLLTGGGSVLFDPEKLGVPICTRRTPQVPDEPCDLELVLDPEFAAAEAIPSETHRSRELQLVLDPEFL